MALVTFQDLPSTSTPLNSANLNNNFNEVYNMANKHIMTAYIDSNYTMSAAGYIKLPINKSINVGTKLTLDSVNNNIVIGAGISKIKVSGKVSFNSIGTSGVKWLTIFKNDVSVSANPCTLSARNMIYATDTLVEVQQNDVISLWVNGTTGDVIRGEIYYTNITVEVIE